MAATNETYYRPYLPSDSEESDSDESAYTRPETPRPNNANPDFIDPRLADELPNFALLAKGLQAPSETSGPSFQTTKQTDAYASRKLDPRVSYSDYEQAHSGKADPGAPAYGKVTSSMAPQQTVIMLQSRDRDKTIFPQPTNCQLFLPRIYKNVTAFTIAQINLTSAFFYFRQDKENLAIQILEKDTVQYTPELYPTEIKDSSGVPLPLKLTYTIRPGSYNISQLLTELQTRLNTPPLFYDFLNGFSDFLPQFSVNGDYSLNFNYPGDYYYDSLRKIYISNPTRAQIVSYYFQNQFANQFTYTTEEVRVAYYYPVLKEYILDPAYGPGLLNLTYGTQTTEEVVNQLLYNFTGIKDPTATAIIELNREKLDTYRILHTFRYALVNKYVPSYDQTNNRVTIQATTLNTSLVNLLNTQYNAFLAAQLSQYGLSAAQYNALYNNNTIILSILQSMYDYLQVNFAKYFAINYGTFSRAYFANSTNTVLIRSGLDASGISIRYDPNVAPTPRDTDLANDFKQQPPYYWNKMSNLPPTEGAQRNMGSTFEPYPASSNFPYSISQCNIDLTRSFIAPDGQIYTDNRRSAGDVLVNVDAGKYTVFRFRSKYRQTLQVETLPRQTAWRYAEWNKNNVVPYPLSNLFDVSYCYLAPNSTLFSKITYDVSYNRLPGWQNLSNTSNNFGSSYSNSSTIWSTLTEQINITNSNGRYYTFQTPLPVNPALKGSNVYTYPFNVTISCENNSGTTPFPSDFYAFFYHDVASFNADVSGVRLESPIFYKKRLDISANTFSNTYSFNAYANQQYYILMRPVSLTPSATQYKIVPWFPAGTSFSTLAQDTNFNPLSNPSTMISNWNVAKAYDPDFIRLPVFPSTLWQKEPTDAVVNQTLASDPPPIGYDISGVSNDLTDFMGFTPYNTLSSINPASKVRIDPTNNYIFQYNSPYDLTKQSYFYPGSQNALLTSNAEFPYTWKSLPKRQYKFVNWYATTYIQDVASPCNWTSNDISVATQAYTISTTNGSIFGYTYQGSNQALSLGTGTCGYTFLPTTGTWAIDRITFKSNFLKPEFSRNQEVHALAVFFSSEILSRPTSFIKLSNALAICLRTGTTTYTPSNLNIGFDAGYGTYYTYSNISSIVQRTNFTISGFTQNSKTLVADPNAYYSIVAFNFPQYTNWNLSNINLNTLVSQFPDAQVTYIQHMTGAPIAYPFANQASAALSFYDGTIPPTGQGVVISSSNGNSSPYGPPVGADESIVQYEQSFPYVNSHIHYLSPQNIISDPSGFTSWSNLPIQPTMVHGSIPNTLLLQNGIFNVATYSTITNVTGTTNPYRQTTLKSQLTIQQIFPDFEQTSLIGVSGTTSNYVFLGASNGFLRFKVYNPYQGTLSELSQNQYYTWSNSLLLQHFVFHNNSQWFVSAFDQANQRTVLFGDTQYNSNFNTMFTYTYANTCNTELAMDPQGAYLYFATVPTNATGFSTMSLFTFSSNDTQGYVRNNSNGYRIALATGNGLPPVYKQIAVTINNAVEEILLTNTTFAAVRFYKLRNYQPGSNSITSNALIDQSVQQFQDNSGNYISPVRILGGYGGSKWVMFNDKPFLQGNRNDAYDAPIALNIAWQIFFPTLKVELRKISNGASAIVDLTGIQYPEWPHTSMFAYSNYVSFIRDISGVTGTSNQGKWGLERNSNFMVSDISFNGFYFNSYMMSVPLQSNYSVTGYSNDYYLAVRGFTPTEQFQTMLRFYLPNRYDFGFVKLNDLANELSKASNIPLEFNPLYRNTLLSFNSNFTFSNKNFGSNPTSAINGSNLTSSNYWDFLNQYNLYYQNFSTNSAVLSQIQSTLQGSVNEFITDQLKYILPASSLNRQRFTDALTFSIFWKSQLSPNYVNLDDEWGLGWNLGYAKKDTPFATVHTAESFFKIQQDFIYLRLNPEFNINRMDAGGKENYATTREPTGITNQYYCKLLLTNFGGNATTFIHNPITFNPPLARLTKLEFQWIDPKGGIINNNDSEWNMTVNITEKLETTTLPEKMEYTPAAAQAPGPLPFPNTKPASSEPLPEPPGDLNYTRTGGINYNVTNQDVQTSAQRIQQTFGINPKQIGQNQGNPLDAIAANTYTNQFSPLASSQEFADLLGQITPPK